MCNKKIRPYKQHERVYDPVTTNRSLEFLNKNSKKLNFQDKSAAKHCIHIAKNLILSQTHVPKQMQPHHDTTTDKEDTKP